MNFFKFSSQSEGNRMENGEKVAVGEKQY